MVRIVAVSAARSGAVAFGIVAVRKGAGARIAVRGRAGRHARMHALTIARNDVMINPDHIGMHALYVL